MAATRQRPFSTDGRARSFTEDQVIDHLLVYGWVHALRHGDRDRARREARATLERWLAAGLPFARAADDTRLLDPAEVMNFGKWAGMEGDDPFYRERFVPRSRALVRSCHPPASGAEVPPPLATLPPRRFAVTLERAFALARAPTGRKPLLRMPAPLPDERCRDLVVTCTAPADVAVDFAQDPGRIDARFATLPAQGTLALTLHATFTAHAGVPDPQGCALSAADHELYLRPVEGVINVTPTVQALARRLAGHETDPWRTVGRFWNFILDELTCGIVDYTQVDAERPSEYALDSGWFDCQMSAALLVALCRSRGLPARIVSGYLLYVDSPSIHWWVEVALPDRGWTPFDTISSDLSASGRDAPWRDYFLGNVDYRMRCECLPRVFNRSPGFRLPSAWRMLWRADGDVTEIGFYAADTGQLAYMDRLVVRG